MKKRILGMLLCGIMACATLSACAGAEVAEPENKPGSPIESSEAKDFGKENEEEKEIALETDDSEQPAADVSLQQTLSLKAKEAAGEDAGEEIDSVFDDFDGDGVYEEFIFLGSEIDPEFETSIGSLWYVSEDKCEQLVESTEAKSFDDHVISQFDVDGVKFIGVNEAYTTALVTYLYTVKDGEVKEPFISHMGYFFKPDYVEDYCVSISAYDGTFEYEKGKEEEGMYTGHTWKNYYYYLDKGEAEFKAYVGTPITEEELIEALGFDLASEIRDAGFELGAMLKRDNGIINVDYTKTTDEGDSVFVEYHNVTYNVNTGEFLDYQGGGKTWQSSDFGGTYEE